MIIVLVLLLCSVAVEARIMLIDKIDKIVCGPTANTPITHTDSKWKKSLSGDAIPLPQQVQMEIVRQQVEEENIPVDESMATKYLESIKTMNDLTQKQLIDLFAEVGLLFEEGKKQLVDQYTYDMFLHHKFRSQVLVTDDQVEKYHKKHPEFEPGFVEIKIASVPYEDGTKKATREKVDAVVAGDAGSLKLEWSDVVKIESDQLSKDKQFINSMKVNGTKVIDNGAEFDLYRLVRKKKSRKKKLDERRTAIIDHLNREQFEKLLEKYNEDIKDKIRLIELL